MTVLTHGKLVTFNNLRAFFVLSHIIYFRGSYSLTLIDALDTLAVMGNFTEFRRVYNLLANERTDFDANINVSVFETNIRIVGGLLSAHLLAYKGKFINIFQREPNGNEKVSLGIAGVNLEPGWPCTGPLLRLAEDAATRLLPAFDTATGMPYGTVNLRHGVPYGETSITCTAGVGTFLVEFGMRRLSHGTDSSRSVILIGSYRNSFTVDRKYDL